MDTRANTGVMQPRFCAVIIIVMMLIIHSGFFVSHRSGAGNDW